jgi:hypothetical protein
MNRIFFYYYFIDIIIKRNNMKVLLNWFVLIVSIAVIVSSCSSSDEESTTSSDNPTTSNDDTTTTTTTTTTAPVIAEVTAVTTPTGDPTPDYTFSSDKAGTITYGGSCSSSNTYPYPSATNGNNTITLTSLIDGTYSDCTITVTGDSASDVSNTLTMSPFTIKCLSKCFVAVGSGSTYSENALTRSQDNGTSWDIAKLPTSDTTLYTAGWSDKYFIASINGVTFGNNTFVAVGGYGFILRSTDNGSSFDLATSQLITVLMVSEELPSEIVLLWELVIMEPLLDQRTVMGHLGIMELLQLQLISMELPSETIPLWQLVIMETL